MPACAGTRRSKANADARLHRGHGSAQYGKGWLSAEGRFEMATDGSSAVRLFLDSFWVEPGGDDYIAPEGNPTTDLAGRSMTTAVVNMIGRLARFEHPQRCNRVCVLRLYEASRRWFCLQFATSEQAQAPGGWLQRLFRASCAVPAAIPFPTYLSSALPLPQSFLPSMAVFPVLYFSSGESVCIFRFPPLSSNIAARRVDMSLLLPAL